MSLLPLLLLSIISSFSEVQSTLTTTIPSTADTHTTIVLCGATGDLASKYLWQSIFDIYLEKGRLTSNPNSKLNENAIFMQSSNHSFSFVGVGRSEHEKGMAKLNSKLTEGVNCDTGFLSTPISQTECKNEKVKFINSVDYIQTSGNQRSSYKKLCDHLTKGLSSSNSNSNAVKKLKLIMYMSITTTAYVSFLENFKSFCYLDLMASSFDVDIQWALEKPFGLDKRSAEIFAATLKESFSEDQISHVDHYLQKSTVKQILQFRYLNKDLDNYMWNRDNIDRVEIFLKETLDVKGRGSFYNNMGVLRDIHQNHLTELLTLIAMDLPLDLDNMDEISKRKRDLIRKIESVKPGDALFGQYADYAKHILLELSNDTKTSDVPTFGAAILKINSQRWRGVPFVLVSGKQLDVKESYIRLVFKQSTVCVSGCDRTNKVTESNQQPPQIVFHINGGELPHPTILVSKFFDNPIWPDNFKDVGLQEKETKSDLGDMYHNLAQDFQIGIIENDVPAYHSVVKDLVENVKTHFVTTQRLLLGWHIWDNVVTLQKNIRIYEKGDPYGILNFKIHKNHLEYVNNKVGDEFDQSRKSRLDNEGAGGTKYVLSDSTNIKKSSNELPSYRSSPSKFLGWRFFTATISSLSPKIASAIAHIANEEIKTKGSFHIALSGGQSVIPVLNSLTNHHTSLSWNSIYVWQVDERCVPHHDPMSNFKLLEQELFRHVDIPFENIHALPVDIGGELCDKNLAGSHLYTETIKSHILNGQFDLIVLGVGEDGHTASLFPQSSSLHVDSDTFVTITEDGPSNSQRRMSMTLPLINRAKNIFVIVSGERKRSVLQKLESSRSVDEYPILGVHPSNGTLTWYIDHLAFGSADDDTIVKF